MSPDYYYGEGAFLWTYINRSYILALTWALGSGTEVTFKLGQF